MSEDRGINAEYSVIGGLMIDNDAIHRIGELREEDFRSDECRLLYKAIRRLSEAKQPYDVVTISEALERTGSLSKIKDGMGGIIQIANDTPGAANITAYAQIVRDHAIARHTRANAMTVANSKLVGEEIVAQAHSLLSDLRAVAPSRVLTARDVLGQVYGDLERRAGGFADDFLSTGIPSLDERLGGGLNRGELVVIAGRPSMGKTVLGTQVIRHIANDHPVLFLSIEQTAKSVGHRMLAAEAKINSSRMKRAAEMEDHEWSAITSGMTRLMDADINIVESSLVSCPTVRSEAEKLKAQKGKLGAILIDYLQLMQMIKAERKDLSVSETTRELKLIAKDMDCPLIAISQLNRGVEQRQNKRPVMADLRESGGIEQDADVIIMCYRDDYYNHDTPSTNVFEAIIEKARESEPGTAYARWVPGQFRLESLSKAQVPRQALNTTSSNSLLD